MANVFGGAEIPAWLQQAARPASGKEIGQTLGSLFDTLGVALQKDPEAPADASWWDSRKGWAAAATDVQNSKVDPMWKQNQQIKLGQWALATESKKLQNETAKLHIDAASKSAQDESEDQQTFAKSMAEVGTDTKALLDAPMPAFKSVKYAGMWQKAKLSAGASLEAISEKERQAGDIKQAIKDHNAVRDGLSLLTPVQRAQVGQPKGKNGNYSDDQYIAVNEMLIAAGHAPLGQKVEKPASAIGKIQADRDKAVASGAPQEVIDAYDASIAKLNASKPGSTLGKLQADRAAAKSDGAPEEVLKAYDAAISKQSGLTDKEPRMMQLPNGQTAVWIPGSKGLHILKDQKQDVQAKAAYEAWKQALSAMNKARATNPKDTATLTTLAGRVASARKNLDGLFKATDQPVPTAAAAPNPSRFTIVPE